MTWSQQNPENVQALKTALDQMAPEQVFPAPDIMKAILMGTHSSSMERWEYLEQMKTDPVRLFYSFFKL